MPRKPVGMKERQKKVLLDFERMQSLYTGFYYFNLHFGKSLLKLAPPNLDFSFYLVPSQFGMFGDGLAYQSKSTYGGTVKRKFLDFFRKKPPPHYDIIHISDQHSSFQPRDKSAKILLTIHDLNYLVEATDDKVREEEAAKHQRMVDLADHIVCISEFSRDCVIGNLNVGDKPVDVIYQGCELEEFEIVERPQYLPKRPFLFTISNVLPKKNFHVLPALLVGNDMELIISGITEHRTQREYVKVIQEHARMHGVEDRVIITGPISDGDRQWYYKNCLAFMFPSLAEGFGTPPLEAMYFGKPVFASTSTSVPEICGDAAYYFHRFDPESMRKTFEEGMAHYNQYKPVDKLRARYEFFNWDKTAREYIELYNRL